MIPENFKSRMKNLLGDEYDEFITALECGEQVKGVRINACKTYEPEPDMREKFGLEKLDYVDNGYIINNCAGIGHEPLHHAGVLYMQDPGAMATLSAVDIKPGWRILDMCAAPGGKSSQAAERLGEGGYIIANEYVPKRAKILVGNLERLGIKNAVVTSLDTSEFKKAYRDYFDLVIVDAPCSGEGMFRKSDEAPNEWSVENVLACAKRQSEILENASTLVRGGGYILYSTCTYSVEENEGTVENFLASHPEYSICEVNEKLRAVTSDGITVKMTTEAYKMRRFYPHKAMGEGQFIALMRRDEDAPEPKILYKDASVAPDKSESAIIREFFDNVLTAPPMGVVRKLSGKLVIMPEGVPVPGKSVFMSGVLIGEIRGKILFPSHQFFSAYGDLFKVRIELSGNVDLTKRYLCGEEVPVSQNTPSGWCVATYRGAPLGGGKVSGGIMKNHYPKGLREL